MQQGGPEKLSTLYRIFSGERVRLASWLKSNCEIRDTSGLATQFRPTPGPVVVARCPLLVARVTGPRDPFPATRLRWKKIKLFTSLSRLHVHRKLYTRVERGGGGAGACARMPIKSYKQNYPRIIGPGRGIKWESKTEITRAGN